jgi:predicted outer membrane repeat protein
MTFHIRDGLSLIGGFNGTEPDAGGRPMKWRALLPVSGGRGSSGWLPDPSLTVLDGTASASYHVVTVGDMNQLGANVSLSDLTITGGNATGSDGGEVNGQSSITSLTYANDAGGGLYARYGSTVTLNNITMTNNACDGSQGTIRGALKEPLLSGGGGIFAADNGTVINVNWSQFTGNQSIIFGGGGAIDVVSNAALNVLQSSFSNNTSGRNGGAIRAKDAGDVNVDGCSFKGNSSYSYKTPADESGGAIGSIDGNLYVSDSVFDSNFGQIGGGAIFFHAPFDDLSTYVMTVDRSVFTNNLAGPFGGGAIVMVAADVHAGSYASIQDCTFTGNLAGQGGAIYESSFNTVAKRCLFHGNAAAQWGGAVLADNFGDVQFFEPIPVAIRKTFTVQDSIIDSNSVVGSLANLPNLPPIFDLTKYPFPFDSPINVAFAIAAGANRLLGTPDSTLIFTALSVTPPQLPPFQIGGGAGSALLSGELFVNNCLVFNNSVAPVTGGGFAPGTGGAFLAGGVNGIVTAPLPPPATQYRSLDYAAIHINNSLMFGNQPNPTATSDLEGVGSTEAAGVFLKVTP